MLQMFLHGILCSELIGKIKYIHFDNLLADIYDYTIFLKKHNIR